VGSVSAENFASLGPSDHVGLTGAAASQPADTQQSEPSASPSNPPGLTVVTVPSQTVASGAADSTAASDASTARSSAPQANDWPIVQLDADELEMLLKRGKEFLADGDLASARLLLRRAVEGGSAEAALVLGTTFDPLVIQRLGVLGALPDIGEARHWYQRAAELGSNTASQRLARLAAAP
jgi:TPR repeat protein